MDKIDLQNFDYRTLKSLDPAQEEALAEALRAEIIKDVSVNGGHLSSNLGVVELSMALLSVFDPSQDDILFDVGHQTYAYKILTGRDISRIRKKDGPSGFQKIGESPYDRYESGHSGSAISVGLGIAAAKKLRGDKSATVIVIGDSSIANGLAFEGLNALDENTYGKIIIILNDNNMSISRPKGALSRFFTKVRTSVFYQRGAGKFKRMFNRKGINWIYKTGVHFKNFVKRVFTQPNFFESFQSVYLGPIDGHDYKKMVKFLRRAQSIDNNVILHIRTVKGKGYPPAEEDDSGYWHGTSAFDPSTGQPLNKHPDLVSFSHISGEAILEKMREDPLTVLITPAMKKGSHLEEAFNEFPTRSFDAGIAEEHAIDLAAGLALQGLHPILSLYATFMQRGYDQLLNDLCRMGLKVMIVVERAGLVGDDGSSHQGIFDVAMAVSMPRMTIYAPSSVNALRSDIRSYDFSGEGPTIIRVERDFQDRKDIADKERYDYYLEEKEGSKTTLLLEGKEGFDLFASLKKDANAVLLNKLKPFPEKLLAFLLKQDRVVLYDPTSIQEGFASYLGLQLTEAGYKGQYEVYALKDQFVPHASKLQQLEAANVDPNGFSSAFSGKRKDKNANGK